MPSAHSAGTGPKSIGKFEDWTAATHSESGQTVCYAFTRAQSSAPVLPGRGAVVLTVTERSSGRDAVAIEAGFAYAPNATVTLQVDQTGLEFYTSGRDAFARDGKAAVTAFDKGSRAIARSPEPEGGDRHLQPEGVRRGLRGHRESLSAEMSDLSEIDRARVLAKSALFDPPAVVLADGRRDLVGMDRTELAAEMAAIGEPAFRVKQLWHWIYHQGVTDFSRMSSIAKPLQAKLAARS